MARMVTLTTMCEQQITLCLSFSICFASIALSLCLQTTSTTSNVCLIREQLSPMLQGFNPTDQTNMDKLLSDFFMARYLEYKDSLNREEEDELRNESVSEAPTPAPAPAKDKKGGKKGNNTEKPLAPAETPVPRLPGATAVGVDSLAVARTAARLLGEPLYRHITSVSVPQAQNKTHLPAPMITILSCGKNSAGKLNLLEEVILMPSSLQRVREVIGMGLELQCEMRRVLNGSAYKAGPIGVTDEGALQVGFERPEQALDLVTEACANLALPLGSDLRLAINCAAHGLMENSRGKYEERDAETMLAAGSGDTSTVDLAVGSGVSFLKLDGLRGRERMDKYNRLMAIEEELEHEGILGAREKKTASVSSFHTFNSGSGCDSVTIST